MPVMVARVVAFDVHETLTRFPSDRVRPVEVQHLLERFGVHISFQAYEAARQAVFFFDMPRRRIEGWMDFLALLFARMEARVSLDLLPDVALLYERRDAMVLYPDAVDALTAARSAGLVTCAFTTLPQFMIGDVWHDLSPHLDHYFDSSAIGLPKGDMRFYQRITQRLEVEPRQILCVGDDPVGDCELPGEVGWRTVLLDREGRHARAEAGPEATIRSLEELSWYWAVP